MRRILLLVLSAVLGAGIAWTPARASDVASVAISPVEPTIVAGGSQTFTVLAFDADGNNLGPVDALVSFTEHPDNPPLGNESPPVGAAGVCASSVCGPFYTRGTVIVHARYDGHTSWTRLGILAGPADHVRVRLAAERTRAGVPVGVAARVEDRYGNATGDGPVGLSIAPAAAGGGSAPGASCTAAACQATDAGTYAVGATWAIGATALDASEQLVVDAGEPAHVIVSATPARVRPRPLPGSASTFSVRVLDQYGNAVPLATVQWDLTRNGSGAGAIIGLASPTLVSHQVTDGNGWATAYYQAGSLPGRDEYTVTSPGSPARAGLPITVTLLP